MYFFRMILRLLLDIIEIVIMNVRRATEEYKLLIRSQAREFKKINHDNNR